MVLGLRCFGVGKVGLNWVAVELAKFFLFLPSLTPNCCDTFNTLSCRIKQNDTYERQFEISGTKFKSQRSKV